MSLLPQHVSMPVAGRTALFLENWGQLTQDPWVLSTVAGYQLPLNCWPERHSARFPQSGKEQDMLLEEVVKLVDKGAVHWISAPEAQVTSLPFPRVGGGLEANNRFKIPQCIYDTTTFQDGGIIHATQHISHKWTMVKLDLKDAYLTVPIAKEYWSLLAFQVNLYTLMQFRCLPFGLCIAPFVFSKVTKPIVQFLKQLGIHLIVYLDDLLLAAPSKDLLLQNLSTVIWLFISLGFLISIPKSVTTPSHCLEFLGFMVDTESMTISLPIHKVQTIQKAAAQLLHQEPMIVKDLAQMIGMLVATKPAVHTGALHYHSLQDLKIQALCRHQSYQKPAQLTQEAKSDLQWWMASLPLHCSNPIVKPEATITIESDASNSGWWATCQGVRTGGRWTSLEVSITWN